MGKNRIFVKSGYGVVVGCDRGIAVNIKSNSTLCTKCTRHFKWTCCIANHTSINKYFVGGKTAINYNSLRESLEGGKGVRLSSTHATYSTRESIKGRHILRDGGRTRVSVAQPTNVVLYRSSSGNLVGDACRNVRAQSTDGRTHPRRSDPMTQANVECLQRGVERWLGKCQTRT